MPSASPLQPPGVHPSRVRILRAGPIRTRTDSGAEAPVVYWMQAAQRTRFNPALAHALAIARELDKPITVVFALTPDYPEATARAYAFMLEGLQALARDLPARGIGFTLALGHPPEVAVAAAREAAVLVVDRGYLRHQVAWSQQVARDAAAPVVQVEGEAIVPVDVASGKAEYAARTLRPKLWRALDEHLDPVPDAHATRAWGANRWSVAPYADITDALSDARALRRRLQCDETVPPVPRLYRGGEEAAQARLTRLLDTVLVDYAADRNQPQRDGVSYLSMHLHFGQISPLAVLLQVRQARIERAAREPSVAAGADGFIEELLVRRELAINFVSHTNVYDAYTCIPAWARATLAKHAADAREPLYDEATMLQARTHDPYWNAAMREMMHTGYQHNYMRMYWGKKVLEWSATPELAYTRLLTWNNRYLLDGRDPNSFTGVGWVFGLHDRPWTERPIFGTVRYMNAAGLRRKADPDAYVQKVEARVMEALGAA